MDLIADVGDVSHAFTLPKAHPPSFHLEDVAAGRPFSGSVFRVQADNGSLAISWWVSPKRTRSYPYSRVYDTLGLEGRKVTIIPFVKDEGAKGDRDFIQWDTISLMSLLGVHVILAHYERARRSTFPGKITDQEFDYLYITNRLKEVLDSSLTAPEWNEQEISSNLGPVAERSKNAYSTIEKSTGVRLHGLTAIDRRIKMISGDVKIYRDESRLLGEKAQRTEAYTLQPKEAVAKPKKRAIFLKNHRGGRYAWTVDEIIKLRSHPRTAFLLEKKHSSQKRVPSMEDIKDALLKLIVFNNIVKLNDPWGETLEKKVCLGLTSDVGTGVCWNMCSRYRNTGAICQEMFGSYLNLRPDEARLVTRVFEEGSANQMIVFYLGHNGGKLEEKILEQSA